MKFSYVDVPYLLEKWVIYTAISFVVCIIKTCVLTAKITYTALSFVDVIVKAILRWNFRTSMFRTCWKNELYIFVVCIIKTCVLAAKITYTALSFVDVIVKATFRWTFRTLKVPYSLVKPSYIAIAFVVFIIKKSRSCRKIYLNSSLLRGYHRKSDT